ncbi:sugar permease, putative [Eimeria mitis]|uniref:Sugar permease, putative n=1 Tax=Eimeria mitis TaxID=44415 RepID=U6K4Q8_9EIME|nr:sugar permease, putative [Eimeria mitis]CDJ31317.1 sugar permease, putative [Eimeria mitis]
MVVTRQGTVTSPAGPPAGGAAAAAAGAAADAAAAAPKGRSPLRAAAQQRAPSRKKRGAASPAAKAAAHRQGRGAAASPGASPRAAAAGRQAAAATPRVHIASRAEVLPGPSTAGPGRRSPAERPLYRGGALKERLQTGPLPFVRQMSDMSDMEATEAENAAALTPRRRRAAAAAAEAEQELTRQSSSSSNSSSSSSSSRQARGTSRPEQNEALEDATAFGGLRARRSSSSSSSSSIMNRSSSSSSSSSRSSSSSSSSIRLSDGKLGQLLLTYFCYASLYLTRKPFASCKREFELQLGLSAAALGGIDSVFLSAYAASQLLLAPALLAAAAAVAAAAAAAAEAAAAKQTLKQELQQQQQHYHTFYCTYFDAGGVFGSVAVGWLSDKYMRGRRMLLLSPLCCLSAAAVLLLHSSLLWGPPGDLGFAAQGALLLAGAAIAAPDSVLGAAAAADACTEEEAADDGFAAAAACIVNGSGSVGSIVQGLLTPTLFSLYGWGGVFNFLGVMAVMGGAALLPNAIEDVEGPPMSFLSAEKASRAPPSQVTGGPPSAAASYTGVQTFLRIRPSSPASSRGPPTTGCLALWAPDPVPLPQQSGVPGWPPPVEAPAGEGPPKEEPQQGGPSQVGASAEGVLGAPLGAPIPFAAGLQCEEQQSLKGLLSLAAGRSRTQTCSIEQQGGPPIDSKPSPAPQTHATPPLLQPAAAVVLLAPRGPQAPAAGASSKTAVKRGCGAPLDCRGPSCSSTLTAATEVPPAAASRERAPARQHQGSLGAPKGAPKGAPGAPVSASGVRGTAGPFGFCGVFAESCRQEVLFDRVGRPAAEAVLRGINACIAVHGASGSGKTYTMVGPPGLLHHRRTNSSKSSSSSSSSSSSNSSSSSSSNSSSNSSCSSNGTSNNSNNSNCSTKNNSSAASSNSSSNSSNSSNCSNSSSNSSNSSSSSSSSKENWGLALRTVEFVVEAVRGRQGGGPPPSAAPTVSLSAVEVYCGRARSLLGPPEGPPRGPAAHAKILKRLPQQRGPSSSVQGAPGAPEAAGAPGGPWGPSGIWVEVGSAEEAVAAAATALSRRVCRATHANSSSSRSHVLLCLSIHNKDTLQKGPRLYLLDLAGAERQPMERWGPPEGGPPLYPPLKEQSGALFAHEAASISKSLSVFMAVLTALATHCTSARLKTKTQGPTGGPQGGPPGGPQGAPLSLLLHGRRPALRAADAITPTGAPNKKGFGLGGPPTQPSSSSKCSSSSSAAAVGAPRPRGFGAPGGPPVRFRDSCLTVALKDVLDGCGHVSLVFTVSSKEADRGPTLQTLRFAALASRLA